MFRSLPEMRPSGIGWPHGGKCHLTWTSPGNMLVQGGEIMITLEEMVETAIKVQPFILEMELQKGVPLNYFDENGQYVLRYPDGHIEKAELPKVRAKDYKCQK